MTEILAIDIGGTNTKLAIGDKTGLNSDIKSLKSSKIENIEDLENFIQDYLEDLEKEIDSISIVSGGLVDRKNLEILKAAHAPKLKFKSLREKFNCNVYLENDANAAALGEKTFFQGEVNNLVYLVMGSGIGAGVIINNELLTTDLEGNIGEVGFSVVNYEDENSQYFSKKGVWEAYCSGDGVSKFYQDFSSDEKRLTPTEIFQLSEKGNTEASKFLDEIAKVNAAGLATIVNNFSPEKIVVGGSLITNHRKFFESIKHKITGELENHIVNPNPEIKLSETTNSELYGALAIATRK
jgi:glucokinase